MSEYPPEAAAPCQIDGCRFDTLQRENERLREVIQLAVSAYEDPDIWLEDARRALG
jgi:hypothetical protein